MLLTAAFATIPSLAQQAGADDQQVLQLRYESVSARVGFSTGVMSDIISLVPQASGLNSNIDKLNADLATLGGYVSAGDAAGFGGFVSGTINPDLQAANQAMVEARTHYREWNVTAATRQALKVKYDARKATFEGQMQQIAIEMGNNRLTRYNDAIARTNGQMTKLSAKGVDVSGIQTAVSSAETNVIQPLQAAVASGNAVQVRTELKDKSLGNGAPYSYHFWAKKDIAASGAISVKLADNATKAGMSDQLAEVNAQIAAAQAALDSADTSPYTTEQKSTIWDNLKSAAQGLEDIIKALGGH